MRKIIVVWLFALMVAGMACAPAEAFLLADSEERCVVRVQLHAGSRSNWWRKVVFSDNSHIRYGERQGEFFCETSPGVRKKKGEKRQLVDSHLHFHHDDSWYIASVYTDGSWSQYGERRGKQYYNYDWRR